MKSKIAYTLLATTFLSTSAVAQTVPEVNIDYLNDLTYPDITWSLSLISGLYPNEWFDGGDESLISYSYQKPTNYTEMTQITNLSQPLYNVVFINQYRETKNSLSAGGAVRNTYSYDFDIEGDFLGNYVNIASSNNSGGAISNSGSLRNIKGNFIDNYTGIYSTSFSKGGAIHNTGKITSITGNFINNRTNNAGGGIYTSGGFINSISGNFISNQVLSSTDYIGAAPYSGDMAAGGGIYIEVTDNLSSTMNIAGNFIANNVLSSIYAYGGAIYSNYNSPALSVNGSFLGNFVATNSDLYLAKGAAVYSKNVDFISDSTTNFISGNFTLDKKRGKIYSGVYIYSFWDNPNTSFSTTQNGSWVINDNIELGSNDLSSVTYNNRGYIFFTGDDTIDTELGTTTQYINMNNSIINAWEVNVENTTLRFGAYQHKDKSAKNWDSKGKFIASLNSDGTENLDADSVTSLTLNNAVFDISNGYIEAVNLKNYSATDSFVHLDVDVENMTSDVINVKGDVDGVTKLVIHATSVKDIRGLGQILFAESFGDTKGNEGSFEVARVYKSPFMYKVIYSGEAAVDVEESSVVITPSEATAIAKNNKWSLEMTDKDNPNEEDAPVDPNPDVPNVDDYIPENNIPNDSSISAVSAPEIIAGIGLHTAGIEQTRTVVRNVSGKVANAHSSCPSCGIISDAWNGKQLYNGWVLAQGEYSNIDKTVDMEAKIWGVEGGFDLQSDMNNTFGIFASYRNGEYDLSGKGARYSSNIGSEIEIDSYLAGLYYRYDKNMNWLFATVYGGTQDAEAKTDDGVASFETDGLEFGASAEIGHSFALSDTTTLSPSLGVYYTQINYDDANDNVGKKYKWNDIKHLEAELGLSLSKNFENGKVYVKPSVIQTLTEDDKVSITGLNEIDTYHDQTLGRIEIGGNYGFNDNWSAYGWANYTFGSDYEATSLGVGVNYAW